jgi:hypothetical protein
VVAVHEAEAADASAGEVAYDGDAETAAAYDQDAAGAEFSLATRADFF